jgi:hypothetical protein
MSRQMVPGAYLAAPIQQNHLATPSSPPAGFTKMYPKSDSKFYYLSSAGVEKPMGAEDPLVVNNATVNNVLTVGTVNAGPINATGDVNARWLYTTDGANGVVQAKNGDLYLRSAAGNYRADSGGTFFISNALNVSGALTVGGALTLSSGSLSVGTLSATYLSVGTSGIYSVGRISNAVSHTGDIANTPGGTGPFEIGAAVAARL